MDQFRTGRPVCLCYVMLTFSTDPGTRLQRPSEIDITSASIEGSNLVSTVFFQKLKN